MLRLFTRLVLVSLFLLPLLAHALSTAFTWQGRLAQAGAASTGAYDFQFALFDAAVDGAQVGATIALPAVAVANGLATVPLDFGALPFTGADRWLEVRVRAAGDTSYTVLAPRQLLAPTPYALFAKAVNWDDILNRPGSFGIYTAGTGLTLAGQEFAIAESGVTTALLDDGAVATEKLADGAVTDVKVTDVAWSKITGAPAALPPTGDAGGDLTGTYPNPTVGTGKIDSNKILDGTIVANDLAAGAVTDSKIAYISWSKLTGVPAGLADGDNDTTYTAGSGLSLYVTQFNVNFAGAGSASTAARSDHNHNTTYWKQGGNAFSAKGSLGTTDNYAMEFKVYGYPALRLEPGGSYTPNIVMGDMFNAITSGHGSVIAGGGSSNTSVNTIAGSYSTIGGGIDNTVNTDYSIIGSGSYNLVDTGAAYSALAGGMYNTVNGNGSFGAIGGGRLNTVSASYGAIGGGYSNTVTGTYGTVAGGCNCTADTFAFAAGYNAKATQIGSFVWGDDTSGDVVAPDMNTFSVRASGGIWLGTIAPPSIPAGRFLNTSTGGYLSTTGTWTNACDRNMKTDFAALDRGDLLRSLAALPITAWRYKANLDERHLGPTAQDFRAAFGLGLDDVSISTVDGIGVALAAAQALDAKVARLETENAGVKAENAALRALLADLAERVQALEQQRP